MTNTNKIDFSKYDEVMNEKDEKNIRNFDINRYNKISINIDDDFAEDENSETVLYIEVEDLPLYIEKEIIELVNEELKQITEIGHVKREIFLYDAGRKYPKLINSEYSMILNKAWKLMLSNITHKDINLVMNKLKEKKVYYKNKLLDFYSES